VQMKLRIAVILGALLAAMPAIAQQSAPGGETCASRSTIVKALTEQYGETQRVIGSADQPAPSVMELYASDQTGTWTLIAVFPEKGIACMIAAGTGFESTLGDAPAPTPEGEEL